MKFKIHRGANEIGGSCVEVWTQTTRILLDFGMPLIERGGGEFNYKKYKNLNSSELIKLGILPDITGLYDEKNLIDAVIISHPHQDHYGLIRYINPVQKVYIGRAAHKLIELSNIFISDCITLNNVSYLESGKSFQIGDISVTPYLMDHSAFDSYSFMISDGKGRIFYSGDFRSHGRKAKTFYWLTHNSPENIDYLLLEGTSISREMKSFKSEYGIEKELTCLFKEENKINLVYASGQNIDRLVSVIRACIRANKILVVDVYVAAVLKLVAEYTKIPFPSKEVKNIRVMFPYFTSKRLSISGNQNILFQFKHSKITKEEISDNYKDIVWLVRPSMQKDLEGIHNINGGNFMYSMWEEYLNKPYTHKFIEYLITRDFKIHKLHTSGHADVQTLKKLVQAICPRYIVPIHTLAPGEYKNIFLVPVIECNDGEVMRI